MVSWWHSGRCIEINVQGWRRGGIQRRRGVGFGGALGGIGALGLAGTLGATFGFSLVRDLGRLWIHFLGLALSEDSATGDGVIQMRVESPLVALEGIERELGVYPALECFEVFGLASLC